MLVTMVNTQQHFYQKKKKTLNNMVGEGAYFSGR